MVTDENNIISSDRTNDMSGEIRYTIYSMTNAVCVWTEKRVYFCMKVGTNLERFPIIVKSFPCLDYTVPSILLRHHHGRGNERSSMHCFSLCIFDGMIVFVDEAYLSYA